MPAQTSSSLLDHAANPPPLPPRYPVYAGTDFIRYDGLTSRLLSAAAPAASPAGQNTAGGRSDNNSAGGLPEHNAAGGPGHDTAWGSGHNSAKGGDFRGGSLQSLAAAAGASSYHATVLALSECDSLVCLAGGLKGGVGYVQVRKMAGELVGEVVGEVGVQGELKGGM
jgi:hypothetical protein